MSVDFEVSPLIPPVARQPVPTEPLPPQTPPVRSAEPLTPSSSSTPPPIMARTKSNKLLKWLILAAAGLFAISVGSLWWGGNSFSDKGVIIALEAEDRITSGDEITYTIK
jgi:hypothetical protein